MKECGSRVLAQITSPVISEVSVFVSASRYQDLRSQLFQKSADTLGQFSMFAVIQTFKTLLFCNIDIDTLIGYYYTIYEQLNAFTLWKKHYEQTDQLHATTSLPVLESMIPWLIVHLDCENVFSPWHSVIGSSSCENDVSHNFIFNLLHVRSK